MNMALWLTILVVTSAILISLHDTTFQLKNLNSISAIEYITRVFILQRTKVITFSIEARNKSMSAVFGDMIGEILKQLDFVKVQVDGAYRDATTHREFNIMFVDSFEAFKRINPAARTKDYDINEHYLIFYQTKISGLTPLEEVNKILTFCWSHYIINVSVLLAEGPHAQVSKLYTYFPFSALQCRNTNAILINKFSNGTLTKGVDWIFPKKLQNLQGCSLTAALWNTPPYFRFAPNQTGLQEFIDFEGVLLGVLAKKLDFSLKYIIPSNDEQRGKRFSNGSTNGAMRLLQDRKADLSLGSFRYTLERAEVLTAALPYYQTWQVFGVLKTSLPYTSIEVLMFPFNTTTWLSLAAFIGIIIVLGVLVVSNNTVCGDIFSGVSLNDLVASLLGVSMPRLPRKSLTRYLLILWIIFAFIMRCAYQSLLFQLLRSNLYRKPPDNLEELVTRDYTLVMTKLTYESVCTVPRIQNNRIKYMILDNSTETSTFAFVEHTPGKFAGISPMDYLTYHAMIESGRGQFHILPEKIFTQHITMYFTKHSFLIERFNELLINLRSFGLIDFWATQSLDKSYLGPVDNSAAARTSMNLTQFQGLFEVYSVLMVVAFLVFLLEVCSKRYDVLKIILGLVH